MKTVTPIVELLAAPESSAERQVAAAVILQAIKDCCDRWGDGSGLGVFRDLGRTGQHADGARSFLSEPSFILAFWAGALGVAQDRIHSAFRELRATRVDRLIYRNGIARRKALQAKRNVKRYDGTYAARRGVENQERSE